MIRVLTLCCALILTGVPGGSVALSPGEQLSDPILEGRARALSKGLRCLVCQNESIDESDAQIAQDLRHLVRERILLGENDREVLAYVEDRYGEFVLLQPKFGGANLVLWLTGPIAFLLVLGGVAYAMRRRPSEAPPLTPEEQAQLDKILKP